ncbi:MAG TPA: ChbG/HpnK family deacetylase [Phycisphaerae bacterium]|nr:ChbG/HpnK family deacetylase [Phycisphaerae bacterium]
MTRLIVNADDFGFSREVTDGILRSHRDGILTSTTLMTNMPDRDRAIDLAAQTPSLGVGIHLNLTQGRPLTPCRRITDHTGHLFRSLPKLFWKLRSPAARQEAADELRAQINYALTRGLKPTHVDSHKHVCHLPWLHDPLLRACLDTGIRWIRCAREIPIPGTGPLPLPYRIQVRFARQLSQKAHAAGLHTTDWFFGLATTGRTNDLVWQRLIDHLPKGLVEVMVHPGYIADITPADTRLLQERLTEMNALCNPAVRNRLHQKGIQLVHFGNAGL